MADPVIIKRDAPDEFFIDEGCFIAEYENHRESGGLSLARARVEPGERTHWHKLIGTVERYLILEGSGLVEVGDLPPTEVGQGDVVVIPAEINQRITNTGKTDLLFLCLCLPGFMQDNYIDTEDSN